jgi:radical SAM protein with 4Fe4S-binding SPASM domain
MVRFVEKAAYKTNSKCLSCDFKINCALCPAKASLESGEEESSPEYFCALTKKRQENLIEKAIA